MAVFGSFFLLSSNPSCGSTSRYCSRFLPGEDRAKLIKINIAAGNDADYFAIAGFAGQCTGDWSCSGAFGDDAVAFGDEAEGGGDFFEFGDEGSVDKSLGEHEHLRKYRSRTDAVDERRLVVSLLR